MAHRDRRCPCRSGRKYRRCCARYHEGAPAPSPEALMRSRYAAYALGLVDYVMHTTHPRSPHAAGDPAAWRADLERFCDGTAFVGLKILDAMDPMGDEAFVTFRASLTQAGQDAGFVERSRFVREDGRWLYVEGAAPRA